MFLTLVIFAFVLGLLVFVHEFGHFIVARKNGVKAEEFGFGFPPRAIGIVKTEDGWKVVWRAKPTDKNFKNTIYSLNWIPLGGFVKIKGEMGEDAADSDSFVRKKIWQRMLILSAGVVMNVVTAAIFLSIGFGIGMPQVLDDEISSFARVRDAEIQIVNIAAGTPAEKAGIASGDIIISIDGKEFDKMSALGEYVGAKEGVVTKVQIKRGEETLEKEITPQKIEEFNVTGYGIGMVRVGVVSYAWYIAPWEGIKETFFYIKEILQAFGLLLKDLVMGGKISVDLSGPVGIAVLTGKVARLGTIYLLQFVALLSVNLAIINFLPFPALDGGRLLFLVIEWFRRKPVNQQIENIIHNIGFTLLLIFIVLITYRDFTKFGGRILEALKTSIGI
jgi:regulator of sigma E protease